MFTSTFWDYYITGEFTYDLGYTMNGCLTGLVAVTAGCATVDTWAAVVIGIGAGWVYLIASKLLIRYRIDDAVDASPVHMAGGAWGIIATGLFTKKDLLLAAFGKDEHYGLCKYCDVNRVFCKLQTNRVRLQLNLTSLQSMNGLTAAVTSP
jgi:Amt family ammonium transporter